MNEGNTTVVKHLAGSNMYKLNTEKSDLDYRTVYTNKCPKVLFGFSSDTCNVSTSDEVDVAEYELRKYVHLLKKTNTSALETLFCDREFVVESSDLYEKLRHHRYEFIDSNKLFNSMRGYLLSEYNRAFGLGKTRKMGEKRKNQLEEYGYGPKNVVHMVRLFWVLDNYCESGMFRVDFENAGLQYDFALSVKTNPSAYTRDMVKSHTDKLLELSNNLELKADHTEFNVDLACEILGGVYLT